MNELRDVRHGLSLCAYELRKATEAAARAAAGQLGRADVQGGDRPMAAMLDELTRQDLDARIVQDNDDKSRLGDPTHLPLWDLLLDPAEGAAFVAKGMTNALACLAAAPADSLFAPGPAFYMEKLVAPPAAAACLDPDAPVEDRLIALAHCLGKTVSELTIFVLEKPRHRALVERILAQGANVVQYPAGDVAGAVLAAIPDPSSGIDALMGTGGITEGLLAACAAKVMGATFLARLDPQLTTERRAVAEAGLDTRRWMGLDHLVRADNVVFCATGITSGLLLDGVTRQGRHERTQSLLIGGGADERQVLTTWHRLAA